MSWRIAEPLGRAAEALLRLLPLGDVGDHADRADQSAVAARRSGWPTPVPRARRRPGGRKRRSRLSPPDAEGRASVRCAPGPRPGVDEVVDPAAEHRAVLVAEQLGHALVDVGDHAAVVRQPDALLRHVHQLLEPLLALLERAGPLLQPDLPALVGGGVPQRRAHEPAEQPERLGVAVGEGVGAGRHDLEHAEGALLVA